MQVAVLAGHGDHLAALAVAVEHGSCGEVQVATVMRNELVPPLQSSRVGV
jgi:hypothetical protein